MQKKLTPEDLAIKLIALLEADISVPKPITHIPFDLEMLQMGYIRTKDNAVGEVARNTFEIALKNWTDPEIKEFLCKWLFEPPHSIQLENAPLDKRRDLFEKVFGYVFEGQKFFMNLE